MNRLCRLADPDRAKGAHVIAAVRCSQADALEIEAMASKRLADEYDAAQDRGEIASSGQHAIPVRNSRATISVAIVAICATTPFLGSVSSYAQECWMITNLRGYSALANENYKFSPDRVANKMLLCFTADGGNITGEDVNVVRFGRSTLAGYGGNDQGNEVFVVYQLDREKQKLLFIKSRIGTKTMRIAIACALVIASITGASTQYLGTGSNPNSHYVSPYENRNGNYVPGHYQTNPNSTQRDNYSTRPNYNPHTGTTGTRKAQD